MDELDRLLADTMRDAAERAPSDDGLLGTVHRRSDRRHRQRIAVFLSAAAAVLAIAVPIISTRHALPPAVVSSPAVTGLPVPLTEGWTPPSVPFTLAPTTGTALPPGSASSGMKLPVGSMRNGDLIAFFEATEQQHHADVTVTVSARKPAFTGTSSEVPVRVRGHSGFFRTVDQRPAKQLTVYWPETPDQWISLATDDTYTSEQVLAMAASLTKAPVPVLPPFQLDLRPDGFVPDTVSDSVVSFRPSLGSPELLRITLRKRIPLDHPDREVGRYEGTLTHGPDGTKLDVDVTDWNATLEVTVSRGLAMSDTDLIRFAAGVHVLNRSNPQ